MALEPGPMPPNAGLLALADALTNMRNALTEASLVLKDALMYVDGPQRAATADYVHRLLARISEE
jgi:hypothetical protein